MLPIIIHIDFSNYPLKPEIHFKPPQNTSYGYTTIENEYRISKFLSDTTFQLDDSTIISPNFFAVLPSKPTTEYFLT